MCTAFAIHYVSNRVRMHRKCVVFSSTYKAACKVTCIKTYTVMADVQFRPLKIDDDETRTHARLCSKVLHCTVFALYVIYQQDGGC